MSLDGMYCLERNCTSHVAQLSLLPDKGLQREDYSLYFSLCASLRGRSEWPSAWLGQYNTATVQCRSNRASLLPVWLPLFCYNTGGYKSNDLSVKAASSSYWSRMHLRSVVTWVYRLIFPLRAWFNFILEKMKEWKELITERLPRKTVEEMFVILIEQNGPAAAAHISLLFFMI